MDFGVSNTWTHILGGADPEDVERYAVACRELEPFVNGLWFSIMHHFLNNHLQQLTYTINPEPRLPHKDFSDLLVVKNFFDTNSNGKLEVTRRWQIIIEGKREHKNNTFENTLDQLVGYAEQLGANQFCYLIAAIGHKCMFWRFDKAKTIARLAPMYVLFDEVGKRGEVCFYDESQPFSRRNGVIYDITETQGQMAIRLMIEWIKFCPNPKRRSSDDYY
ncbi:hypothetical protein H0H92_012370 [Tricholoma furcatifolium]|nr:hypothetical protein H0H92_012370 [Tricholoma furcatifolium]